MTAGLILSGGGARAAYQVGVLKAVAELLPRTSSNPFPIVSGTSAGAVVLPPVNVAGGSNEPPAQGAASGGAAAGAAGGGAGGLMRGAWKSGDPDEIERRFVEQCLRDKGYQVIGWK